MSGMPRAIRHGTIGGYMAHRRREEPPCGSCTTAWRLYYQDRNGDLPRRVWLRQEAEKRAHKAARARWEATAKAKREAARAERLDGRPSIKGDQT